MTVLAQQDIFGFYITVHDFILMQVGESEEDLDDIESGDFFADSFVFFDEAEKFASRTILHDKD